MLGSAIVDVAIGLVFVYVMFSIFVTVLREGLERIMKTRAVDLEKGIRLLLRDKEGSGLVALVYQHPLIDSLFDGVHKAGKLRWFDGKKLPSYIPARNFAVAVGDLFGANESDEERKKKQGSLLTSNPGLNKDDFQKIVDMVEVAIKLGGKDPTKVRRELEAWYDSTMDRVSGWYKRRSQQIVLALGVVAVVACNVNTFEIVRALGSDRAMRELVVANAEKIASRGSVPTAADLTGRTATAQAGGADEDTATNTAAGTSSAVATDTAAAAAGQSSASTIRDEIDTLAEARRQLDQLGLPIGWKASPFADLRLQSGDDFWRGVQRAIGFLLSALAISLGAPFWFDVLNRLMVIRSTVKPHEKSPEEPSQDAGKKREDRTIEVVVRNPDAAAS